MPVESIGPKLSAKKFRWAWARARDEWQCRHRDVINACLGNLDR
jgi:hypothetical protein